MSIQFEKMSNRDFVGFCFQTILGREADNSSAIAYTNALDEKALTRESVLLQFLLSEEFKQKVKNQECFSPGHFYSAIPSIEEREAYLASPASDEEIPGVALNPQEQFDLLKGFVKHYVESPFRDEKSDNLRYHFINPSYSYTDALTLYSMIREFKPKKVIEIGSGYSSCVMLDTNELFFNDEIDFTFIEPYPELFYSLVKKTDNKHTILPMKLQDIDVDIFKTLGENDVLFIDSTHVSKLRSDVNKIFFEILPILQKGVLIHFHDIFWPFEYPLDWVKKGFAWNEAYILRAFLEFNDNFEIIFFANYLHKHYGEWFEKNMPLYCKNTGGNIWLKKVS